jgi:hypothetical protein
MIDRRRSAPLQLENAEKLESGQVREGQVGEGQVGAGQIRAGQVRAGQIRASQIRASQVRANQVRASRAVVPPTLVEIFCVMSPVCRLPMPDITLLSVCFDTSNACFAE